jgi:hypothetical protein
MHVDVLRLFASVSYSTPNFDTHKCETQYAINWGSFRALFESSIKQQF